MFAQLENLIQAFMSNVQVSMLPECIHSYE